MGGARRVAARGETAPWASTGGAGCVACAHTKRKKRLMATPPDQRMGLELEERQNLYPPTQPQSEGWAGTVEL